jgi:hypothetical protein
MIVDAQVELFMCNSQMIPVSCDNFLAPEWFSNSRFLMQIQHNKSMCGNWFVSFEHTMYDSFRQHNLSKG